MNVDIKTLISMLPLGTVIIASIISWSQVTLSTELNEENIAQNEAQIKENSKTIQNLDKKVSIVELKIDSLQDDIRGARADTTLIINMLRESNK